MTDALLVFAPLFACVQISICLFSLVIHMYKTQIGRSMHFEWHSAKGYKEMLRNMWTSKSSCAKPSGGLLLVVGWTNSKSLGPSKNTGISFLHLNLSPHQQLPAFHTTRQRSFIKIKAITKNDEIQRTNPGSSTSNGNRDVRSPMMDMKKTCKKLSMEIPWNCLALCHSMPPLLKGFWCQYLNPEERQVWSCKEAWHCRFTDLLKKSE